MEANGTYRWTPGGDSGKPVDWNKIKKGILLGAVALVVLIGVLQA